MVTFKILLAMVQKLKWVSLKMPSLYVVQYEIHRDCVLAFWDLWWPRAKSFRERVEIYWSNLDTRVPATIGFIDLQCLSSPLGLNVYHFPDTKTRSHNLLCIYLYKFFLILIRRTGLYGLFVHNSSLCSIYLKVGVFFSFFNFHMSAPRLVV